MRDKILIIFILIIFCVSHCCYAKDVLLPTDKTFSNDYWRVKGIVRVVRNEKEGIYDVKNQKFLIQPIYDAIAYNKDGLSLVHNENKFGVINTNTGILVLPIIYDNILPSPPFYENDLWILTKNGKSGLWDPSSEKIVYPVECDKIEHISDKKEELFLLKKGSIEFFCNTNGEKIKKSVIWYKIREFARYIIPATIMFIICILNGGHE